jgi:hypothetical protein
MTADIEVVSNERVAALVKSMQFRLPRGSVRRHHFWLAFEDLAPSPSAWDTFSLVQAEMNEAGRHVHAAYEAVADWLLRGQRAG